MSKNTKWPLKYRFWHFVHAVLNRLAWRFGNPGGPINGRALRIDDNTFWWRLNTWAANKWSPWYIEQRMPKARKGGSDDQAN